MFSFTTLLILKNVFLRKNNTVIPRFRSQLVPKKKRHKSKRRKLNFMLLIQSRMFLTRNLKKLYDFTVIPIFTMQLVSKKGNINRMTTQIEIRGNKKFYDVNRSNYNRGKVNRRIIVK